MKSALLPDQPILQKIEGLGAITQKNHKTFEKGTPGFNSSDTLEYFYFIINGKIKITQVNPESGREQTLYLLSRGDMFDVVTLLDTKPHDYVAEVLESADVVEVPLTIIQDLLKNDPHFKEMFFPYVAKHLRSMENLAVDLSLYDVYQRIIHLFARYVDTSEHQTQLKVINNLSHEEIASMIGSVRKVVNRSLQQLKQEGVIDFTRKNIKLTSLQRLLEKL